jgi:hypothetical protein
MADFAALSVGKSRVLARASNLAVSRAQAGEVLASDADDTARRSCILIGDFRYRPILSVVAPRWTSGVQRRKRHRVDVGPPDGMRCHLADERSHLVRRRAKRSPARCGVGSRHHDAAQRREADECEAARGDDQGHSDGRDARGLKLRVRAHRTGLRRAGERPARLDPTPRAPYTPRHRSRTSRA